MAKRLRVYADTSVFGGCFDGEFAEASRQFFTVQFEKIRGYHAVNLMEGYAPIPIHSPREVVKL